MQKTRILYSTVWKTMGSGILVALMFVVVASASMMRNQTTVADLDSPANHKGTVDHRRLSELLSDANPPVSHSVQLTLPLEQLRDADGRLTPKGESLFLLLARRMKSLSLDIMLTAQSFDDAAFATAISAHVMNEVALEPAQIRISMDGSASGNGQRHDAALTVTITRHEAIGGESK